MEFPELYEKYRRKVEYWVKQQVFSVDQQDIEDLTQDIFVKAAAALHTFDSEKSTVDTWLHTITRNTAIDFLRSRDTSTTSYDTWEGGIEEQQVDEDSNPESILIRRETLNDVMDAVGDLPDRQRQVVVLLAEGLSYVDVAIALESSEAAVKSLAQRARVTLRKQFGGVDLLLADWL